jgi:GT2 family glycosyltransferase
VARAADLGLGGGRCADRRDGAEIYHGRQRRDVGPGANVAIPREVVLELGGYDERLGAGTRFGGAEDNDIGLRLLDAGCEVRHIPDAVMLHRAWRSREARLRLRWAYALGKGAFYAKHAHLHDPYTLRRLRDDIGSRSRRLLRAGIRRPRSLAGEAVTIVGLLSGFLSWTVLERVPRAAGRPRAQR